MKELFKFQLENNKIITDETLEELKNITYKNGDEIKVGDLVLYALLTDASADLIKKKDYIFQPPMERTMETETISLVLITLNESQFDLYTFDDRFQGSKMDNERIPIIRLK